jgi:MFS family permease
VGGNDSSRRLKPSPADASPPLRRNRDFVLLQAGQLLSTLGNQSSYVAYPLLVLAVTHSPAKAGLVGFAGILPYPLFVLPAGLIADRFDRKRVMIVADVVRVAALGGLAAALVAGSAPFALIFAVAFVDGTMFAFFNIAEVGALRAVVPKEQLPHAAAAEQARLSTVILTGPPLGGFLFGLGRSLPFLADAISYVFSLISVLAMRTPFQEERRAPEGSLRTQMTEGFSWLWRQPFLRGCAVLFAFTNFGGNALYLFIIVAGQRQGLGPAAIGLLIAIYGGLSLVGSLISPRVQRLLSMRTILVASLWLAVGIGVYVIRPDVYLLIAGVVPLALLNPSLNAVVIGYRVAIVPDRLQGRVNSVARMIAQVGAPLGPLAAGVLLGAFSARETCLFLTAWFAAIALWATLSPSIRNAPKLTELAEAD